MIPMIRHQTLVCLIVFMGVSMFVVVAAVSVLGTRFQCIRGPRFAESPVAERSTDFIKEKDEAEEEEAYG